MTALAWLIGGLITGYWIAYAVRSWWLPILATAAGVAWLIITYLPVSAPQYEESGPTFVVFMIFIVPASISLFAGTAIGRSKRPRNDLSDARE